MKPLLTGLFCLLSALLGAHSIPDVPVRGNFQTGGEAEITIEINPRNWADSPKLALSLENKEFLTYTDAQREELLKQTRAWVAAYLEFTLEPIGRVQPDFTYDFVAETGKPLMITVEPPKDFQELKAWLANKFGRKSYLLPA